MIASQTKKLVTRRLKSRSSYGQPRWETVVGNHCYLLSGKTKYMRFSAPTEEDLAEFPMLDLASIAMVDLEGGPSLSLGQNYYPGPDRLSDKVSPETIVDLRLVKKPDGRFKGILIKTKPKELQ